MPVCCLYAIQLRRYVHLFWSMQGMLVLFPWGVQLDYLLCLQQVSQLLTDCEEIWFCPCYWKIYLWTHVVMCSCLIFLFLNSSVRAASLQKNSFSVSVVFCMAVISCRDLLYHESEARKTSIAWRRHVESHVSWTVPIIVLVHRFTSLCSVADECCTGSWCTSAVLACRNFS